MKKGLIFTLAVSLVMAGFIGFASAAQNVANTTQKGSLLVFPKIDVNPGKDTIIEINNDYNRPVDVRCLWVNSAQEPSGFDFTLKANQPVWFSAKTGQGTPALFVPGFNSVMLPDIDLSEDPLSFMGELKCFAVVGDQQISFNHLYGSATIIDFEGGNATEYNSWNFTARGVSLGKGVGSPGKLELKGSNGAYDACPEYLVTDFVAAGGEFHLTEEEGGSESVEHEIFGFGTSLTLVPCKQDLRQDREATFTKAKFDIWNEWGTKYSGAYKCLKCWFDGVLHQMLPVPNPFSVMLDQEGNPIPEFTSFIGAFGAEKFTYSMLHTPKGRLRIQGVKSTVCETDKFGVFCPFLKMDASAYFAAAGVGPKGSTQPSPFIGLVMKMFSLNGGDVDPGSELKDGFFSALSPNTAGYDGSGFILFDPGPEVIPEFAR